MQVLVCLGLGLFLFNLFLFPLFLFGVSCEVLGGFPFFLLGLVRSVKPGICPMSLVGISMLDLFQWFCSNNARACFWRDWDFWRLITMANNYTVEVQGGEKCINCSSDGPLTTDAWMSKMENRTWNSNKKKSCCNVA